MTGQELLDLFNKTKKPITIKFNKDILDIEDQFEEGMVADILNIYLYSDEINILVDESNYKKYNESLETNSCFNKKDGTYSLKWSEFKGRKDKFTFSEGLDYEIINFKIENDCYNQLRNEYLSCNKNISYLDWLQELVIALRTINK